MRFDPSPEQREFLTALRGVIEADVAPSALAWDRAAHVPLEAVHALGAAGASGIDTPPEWGGRGLDAVSFALAIEEISSVLPALGLHFSTNNSSFCRPIACFGSESQKRRFLEPVASGRAAGAFAIAEEGASSDVSSLATTARRVDGGYVLRGEKAMVTNGGLADFVLVVADLESGQGRGGSTALLVPADLPGVHRGPRVEMMGLRSADVRHLRFENVRLEAVHRLGEEQQGSAVVREAQSAGRIGVAAQAVGTARGAYEKALAHARHRRRLGRFLCELPAVRELLARMVTEIDAARLTTLWAAQLLDAGDSSVPAAAARAKLAASEMGGRVTSLAIQVHGGWGYLADTGVERFHRDAKATELYEGTSEILQQVIADSLTKA